MREEEPLLYSAPKMSSHFEGPGVLLCEVLDAMGGLEGVVAEDASGGPGMGLDSIRIAVERLRRASQALQGGLDEALAAAASPPPPPLPPGAARASLDAAKLAWEDAADDAAARSRAAAFLVASARVRRRRRSSAPSGLPGDAMEEIAHRRTALQEATAAADSELLIAKQPPLRLEPSPSPKRAGAPLPLSPPEVPCTESDHAASPVSGGAGVTLGRRLQEERAAARVEVALKAWLREHNAAQAAQPRWSADANRRPLRLPDNFGPAGDAGPPPAVDSGEEPYTTYMFGTRSVALRCSPGTGLRVLTAGGVEVSWDRFVTAYSETERRRMEQRKRAALRSEQTRPVRQNAVPVR
eukprot:Hpha_TRINITY_DN1142_c0_g1::TRINITY_DN1142_c0_g1_i2::g.113206::m.113206